MSEINNKRLNESNNILTGAAFIFSLISLGTTASGLNRYVFDSKLESVLISFAIQSILFVFNLNLPEYISKILNNKRFERNVNIFFVVVTSVFYVLILFSSSTFTFVYISNTIYEKTWIIDANSELENTYRNELYALNDFVNVYAQEVENEFYEQIKVSLNSNTNAAAGNLVYDFQKDLVDFSGDSEILWIINELETYNGGNKVQLEAYIENKLRAVEDEIKIVEGGDFL